MIKSVPTTWLVIVLCTASYAQEKRNLTTGTISGSVFDAYLDAPLEYANVVLYRATDSTQVTGTVTDMSGHFQMNRVRPGAYYIEIGFMGYETRRTETIRIATDRLGVDLGTMALSRTILSSEGVVVEGEPPPITYQIDKKVIHVSQQQTAISGTAVDLLENVPSVTVDIEGNVSLRGSSNFSVLIDGRPSVLEANDALQQIPASSIETIEIITNPSAKYDPEGTAGIINIILKKNQRYGSSGTVNMNAGWDDKYGGDILLENKTKTLHGTISVDYNKRPLGGRELEDNQTTQNGQTSFISSQGNSLRQRTSLGFRGKLQLKWTPKNIFSLGGRYGGRDYQRNSDLNYDEWAASKPNHLFYTSSTLRQHLGHFFALNLNYQHLFNQSGHELAAELHFDRNNGDEKTVNELINDRQAIVSGQTTTESGPGKEFRAKLDYVHPFGDERKFESGYQSELDYSRDNTNLFEYTAELGEYVFQPAFSNLTDYNRNVHSVYALYAGKWQRLGYQLGLRGEYTDRTVDFSGQTFSIERWDTFPTFHASYQFPGNQQIMASYTRRIDRPRGRYLEPFQTWIDAYNVRVGNPSLKPEYIDSYEAGFQMQFGQTLFSTEAYYRVNHNRIEQVRSVYAENITLHSRENVGTDYSLGAELLLDLDLLKNWDVHLMGNLYRYRIEGTLRDDPFARKSFNWSTRLNNVIKIGKSTEVQINGRYNSPTVSSQGRREGFFVAEMALKHDFFERQASVTLQIRDLLSTAKYESVSEGADFYTYYYSTRESPVVMLNLRYNLNHPKADRLGKAGGE